MAEEVEKEVTKDEFFAAEYQAEEEVKTVEDFAAALGDEFKEPEKKVEPESEKKVEPEKPVHSAQMIAQAARLDIPVDEIEEMTPGELKRAIAAASRFQKSIESIKAQIVPRQEAKVEPEDDLLAGVNEETLLPEVVGPLKKMADAIKKLQTENKTLRQEHQAVAETNTHQRVTNVLNSISPELSKEFESTEAKEELYGMLGALLEGERRAGKLLDEPTRVRRALAALDRLPTEAPKAKAKTTKEIEFEKKAAEYDAGALGVPVARNTEKSLFDQLREKRKAWAAKAQKEPAEEEVNQFLPG